jgi:hypothetical protein
LLDNYIYSPFKSITNSRLMMGKIIKSTVDSYLSFYLFT